MTVAMDVISEVCIVVQLICKSIYSIQRLNPSGERGVDSRMAIEESCVGLGAAAQ